MIIFISIQRQTMKYFTSLIFSLTIVLFSGCISHPQSAQEFRVAIPDAFMAEVETITVNRPFAEVAKTFKKKAPKCLDVKIKTVSQSSTSYQVLIAQYNPTVVIGAKKAELHLQRHYESGVMNVSQEPKDGYYLLVVDAIPISKNKTKIVFYRPSMGFDSLITAIKGWASGDNLGCPDLTQ